MNVTISDVCAALEEKAPRSLQESYDNSGLLVGNSQQLVTGVLCSLDVTEDVLDEAIERGCNLVVCHHPIIFSGLKQLTGSSFVERVVIKAIKNDIAIFAGHTNFDNINTGVNRLIGDKLNLKKLRILKPKDRLLSKLITFVPVSELESLQEALWEFGAGNIGDYSKTSFHTSGTGTFLPGKETDPFIGEKGELSREPEERLEVIFEKHNEASLVQALLRAHPYEEVAYDLFDLQNKHQHVGAGMIGELAEKLGEEEFLELVKVTFKSGTIKYTPNGNRQIQRVAVCGGSGQFLLKTAIRQGADAFISSDFKYHDYFEADAKLLIADIGHYESEQFTPEIFKRIIEEKFRKFAILLSGVNTNPVKYY